MAMPTAMAAPTAGPRADQNGPDRGVEKIERVGFVHGRIFGRSRTGAITKW